MNEALLKEYRRMREAKPFMLIGRDAECSLDAAKTVLAFRDLGAQGKVRLRIEDEQESYFDVYGEPDTEKERQEIIDTIDRLGCVCVISEVWEGCAECGHGDWEIADSIGMCVYNDPASEYENCYVVQLMAAAVEMAQG